LKTNAANFFRPHYARRNLKTQKSPINFNLCLSKKTPSGKPLDYRDAIVFVKLRFQNLFRPKEKESQR